MLGWDGIEECVAVDRAGSFAGAAKALNVSSSHVSRAVVRLEDFLQIRIFNRTTRRVIATDEGRALIDQLGRIVEERDQAFAKVAVVGAPQGDLKITCSIALGDRYVVPIVRQFALDFPNLNIVIDLNNRLVDLVAEGYDIAIRTGGLRDSDLIASRIAARRLVVCAAPEYLSERGAPRRVDDLAQHACLIGTNANWTFSVKGNETTHRVKGRWHCNSGESTRDAALAGMGLCQLPDFYVRDAINDGRLIAVLEEFAPEDQPIWAVYLQRRHMLPKIRLLVERLKAQLQAELNFHASNGAVLQ